MASSTHVQASLGHPSIIPTLKSHKLDNDDSNNNNNTNEILVVDESLLEEASHLATLFISALTTIKNSTIDSKTINHGDEATLLALPLTVQSHRLPETVATLPRRKSARGPLAVAIASLLRPSSEAGSLLNSLIKYENDRKCIRDYLVLQRKFDLVYNTKRNAKAPTWDGRIKKQGPWRPTEEDLEVLKKGCPALPMPVRVPGREEFEPFLEWVAKGGTHLLNGKKAAEKAEAEGVPELDEANLKTSPALLNNGAGEDHYQTPGLEFRRGVLYEDARLDLCKQVVGPNHIGALMDSLRTNAFVQHFLLGNNIIGPVGVKAIADFITDYPDRIYTWYLAGNCIDGAGFKSLVDAMVQSKSVTNIWLKRNPLGPDAAKDLARLITQCQNLRTLDLDQTELGDEGAAGLFELLAAHESSAPLSLRILYLNGTGFSIKGAAALGRFLASSAGAAVESIYLSCNPLTDAGAFALAEHLPMAKSLTRLSLQSVGIGSDGVIALCNALKGHESLRVLDIGQAYATIDLGVGFNYVTDFAAEAMVELLTGCKTLEYFNLGHCAMSPNGLGCIMKSVAESQSLLVYQGSSFTKRSDPEATAPWPHMSVSTANMFSDSSATISASEVYHLDQTVRDTLHRNVRAKYGDDMTYQQFWDDEKRWVVSDHKDVRKIDSVYRTRDMRSARRGEMVLVKLWEDGDDTLEKVMGSERGKPSLEGVVVRGPVCPLKKARLEQQETAHLAVT